MTKKIKNVEEVENKKDEKVVRVKSPDMLTTGITLGIVSAFAVISSVHETKLDEWKEKRYQGFTKDFYDKIEVSMSGMSCVYKNKAHQIVESLVKRFYNAPTRKGANKSLATIKDFVGKIEKTAIKDEKAAIVLEYAAKYITPDVVMTKKYDYWADVKKYQRY